MTIDERLDRIEELLRLLVEEKTVKEWYTTAEAAKILGKAEWTFREYCRLGRVSPASVNAAVAIQRNGLSLMKNYSGFKMRDCYRTRALFEDQCDGLSKLVWEQRTGVSKVASVCRCRSAQRIVEICVGVRHVFATDARNAAAAQSRRSQRVAVEECHEWRFSRRLAIPCWDHQIPTSGDVKKLPD